MNHQWFKYRVGRITASQIYHVVHTNPHQPSLSLLQKICYPETQKLKSEAVIYGCNHEVDGKKAYKLEMVQHHNLFMRPCGFIVDKDIPYMGASPDALVECTCCGKGVLEIKCPWSAKDFKSLRDAALVCKNFCLELLSDGTLKLLKKHPYYLQCQLQMHVTSRRYCDFVVWHPNDMHVERIYYISDDVTVCLPKIEQFFRLCILPELFGKWYTRLHDVYTIQTSVHLDTESEEDNGSWCYCKESKGGEMVNCDSKSCSIKWFHVSCFMFGYDNSPYWKVVMSFLSSNCKTKQKIIIVID